MEKVPGSSGGNLLTQTQINSLIDFQRMFYAKQFGSTGDAADQGLSGGATQLIGSQSQQQQQQQMHQIHQQLQHHHHQQQQHQGGLPSGSSAPHHPTVFNPKIVVAAAACQAAAVAAAVSAAVNQAARVREEEEEEEEETGTEHQENEEGVECADPGAVDGSLGTRGPAGRLGRRKKLGRISGSASVVNGSEGVNNHEDVVAVVDDEYDDECDGTIRDDDVVMDQDREAGERENHDEELSGGRTPGLNYTLV